jgi:hypothetical protein
MENENESQEYQEKKELILLQRETDELKHKFKMEELNYERQTSIIVHEKILERGRIQRAEERKMILYRKEAYD